MSKGMGFLDKLWDETLAGPAPEKGLGKLRKYNSLSAVRSSSTNQPIDATRYHDHHDDRTVPISRSITILRTKNISVDPVGSSASSPTTSSGPSSPFSPGKTGLDPDVKRFTRKKPIFDSSEYAEATTTAYDWILISALDR